jgi:hypothetical protein
MRHFADTQYTLLAPGRGLTARRQTHIIPSALEAEELYSSAESRLTELSTSWRQSWRRDQLFRVENTGAEVLNNRTIYGKRSVRGVVGEG